MELRKGAQYNNGIAEEGNFTPVPRQLIFTAACSVSAPLTRSGNCNALQSSRYSVHKLFRVLRLNLTPSHHRLAARTSLLRPQAAAVDWAGGPARKHQRR